MECAVCGANFAPKHPRGRFCSPKCRSLAWRDRLRREKVEACDQIERGLATLRRLTAEGW